MAFGSAVWCSFGWLSRLMGPLGAIFVRLGTLFGPSWPSWALLKQSWALLGMSWGPLGPSWGPLGAVLEALLGRLGAARHGVEHKMASGEPQEPFLS